MFLVMKNYQNPRLRECLQNYRLLRVLHFEGDSLYNYVRLTENFGDLSLLTYLSFRNSKIVNLPKSVGVLHNLETLDLRESGVRRMPREIYKLKKLRHLLVYDKLFGFLGGLQMEGGIGDLTSLQTLRDMDADHVTEEVMKGLERLTIKGVGLDLCSGQFKSSLCSLINKMQRWTSYTLLYQHLGPLICNLMYVHLYFRRFAL
ncbi:hypothetical protein AAZX31_U014700 [Glycine max]